MAPPLRGLQAFLVACILATLAGGVWMAQPWGDNYAYRDASGYLTLAVLLVWAVSPVSALAIAAPLFQNGLATRRLFAAGAACIGLAGLLAYLDVALLHPDPQGGLAFVSVPALQWIAALVLGGACALVRRTRRTA